MMSQLTYPIVIEPLPPYDGGGFSALVPDLPGCMSDGETPGTLIKGPCQVRGW